MFKTIFVCWKYWVNTSLWKHHFLLKVKRKAYRNKLAKDGGFSSHSIFSFRLNRISFSSSTTKDRPLSSHPLFTTPPRLQLLHRRPPLGNFGTLSFSQDHLFYSCSFFHFWHNPFFICIKPFCWFVLFLESGSHF